MCFFMIGICRKVFLLVFAAYAQSKLSILINIPLLLVVFFHIRNLVAGLKVNVNLHTPEYTLTVCFP